MSTPCTLARCPLIDLVKDHVTILMRLVQEELSYYDLSNTTQCLNTAVMVITLYLGDRERALDVTKSCDVRTVKERRERLLKHVRSKNPSSTFDPTIFYLDDLRRLLLDNPTPPETRCLYYVMITDSYLNNHVDTSKQHPTVLFPGHVFVIEHTHNDELYLYQSYISEYDIKAYRDQLNKETFKLDKQILKEMFDNFSELFVQGRAWTYKTTAFWQRLTKVYSPQFEGYIFKDSVHLCFRMVPIKTCTETLNNLISRHLHKNKSPNLTDNDRHELQAIQTIIAQVPKCKSKSSRGMQRHRTSNNSLNTNTAPGSS